MEIWMKFASVENVEIRPVSPVLPNANTNGTVNPNVSTPPIAIYVEADVVIIEIGWELMVPWLFVPVENVEIHHVLSTIPGHLHCLFTFAGILHIITDCSCFRASCQFDLS